MPDQLLHSAKPSLAYAKLVATPTSSSWSQVYNAGNLFACLSLTVPTADNYDAELPSLHTIGKEIFNILESEFFTLEEKNIETIKQAITTSINHAPPMVSVDLSLALFKDAVLYVFIAGGGKILMKRGDKVGILLENSRHNNAIVSASGLLSNNDTLILETDQFAKDITYETVVGALDLALPNDIAEALSPQIHEKDDGGQAAIIVVYHGISHEVDEQTETLAQAIEPQTTYNEPQETLSEPEVDEEALFEEEQQQTSKHFSPKLPHIAMPKIGLFHLSHRKKLFLSIAIILVAILIASIIFTRQEETQAKQHQLFTSIYEPAQKSYDEGKALESLNKTLSHDDFLKAEKLLKENQNKFQKGSPEEKQINDLLAKVETELGAGKAASDAKPAKEADADASEFLKAEKAAPDSLAFGTDGTSMYAVTSKAVTKINGTTKKDIIKNNKDWEAPKAIVPYQNIYILDQKNGVLKYTAGSDGYDKSSYFKKSPDLSKAISMAIDGSVWILFSDGTILKYTKGESDGFKVKGLDKPLSSPTKIFTSLDTDSIYILDTGNDRVVKIAKDGSFQSQYESSTISEAKDFDVNEKDKKIYFLGNDKLYEVEMK